MIFEVSLKDDIDLKDLIENLRQMGYMMIAWGGGGQWWYDYAFEGSELNIKVADKFVKQELSNKGLIEDRDYTVEILN